LLEFLLKKRLEDIFFLFLCIFKKKHQLFTISTGGKARGITSGTPTVKLLAQTVGGILLKPIGAV
jgi:hypothetical protein